MAATYVNNLRVAEPADGDTNWGNTTNTSLELIGEALGVGTEAITTNADTHTSTVADGSSDQARAFHLKYTGTLDSNCTVTIGPNTMKRVQIIENATTGGYSLIISQGSGDNVTILAGTKKIVYLDGAGSGAAVVDVTSASFGSQAFYVPSGSTGNRPTGVAGAFRYNSTSGEFEGYAGGSWGSIGGGTASTAVNEYSGNGSTTAFTLSSDPGTENNTQVYIDGVYQEKGTYSVSGTTLTFSTAPPNGTSVEVLVNSVSDTGTPSDGTVTTDKLADDAVTSAKLAHTLDVVTSLGVGGGSTNGVSISQGAIAIKNGGAQSYIDFYCESSNAHYARILAPAHASFAGNITLTLPATTDTLVGKTTTDTLTNKTLTSPKINEDVAVTSTATEINLLDGVTATTSELNILDGVTATATEINLLDGVTATTTELNYLDITTLGTTEASKAVTADANGVVKFDNGITEESTALTSGTSVTLNIRDGSVYTITLAHNIGTFTWSNPAGSGYSSSFTLKVTQDGTGSRTISWPASVDWAGGTAPTLSTGANDVDVFVFFTVDGGTTYYGFTAGQDMT